MYQEITEKSHEEFMRQMALCREATGVMESSGVLPDHRVFSGKGTYYILFENIPQERKEKIIKVAEKLYGSVLWHPIPQDFERHSFGDDETVPAVLSCFFPHEKKLEKPMHNFTDAVHRLMECDFSYKPFCVGRRRQLVTYHILGKEKFDRVLKEEKERRKGLTLIFEKHVSGTIYADAELLRIYVNPTMEQFALNILGAEGKIEVEE